MAIWWPGAAWTGNWNGTGNWHGTLGREAARKQLPVTTNDCSGMRALNFRFWPRL
jgi:hypothetical protein